MIYPCFGKQRDKAIAMKINLHDAILHSIIFSTEDSTVVVLRIFYYEHSNSKLRTKIEVRISNVKSMSSVVDCGELADNASAGNISDWSPAKRRGFTFFHLVGGAISIFGDPPVIEYIP